MAETIEDLGFREIGVQPQVGGAVAPPQPQNSIQRIGNAAHGFNQMVEGTGLPNFSRGFFQGGTNALTNMANFGADLTGIPKQYRIPQADFGADTSTTSGGFGDLVGAGSTYFVGGPLGAAYKASKVPKGVQLVRDAFPEIAQGLAKGRNALLNATSKIPGATNPLAQRIAAGTPGAAAFGASQSPEDRLGGAALGAATNVGTNALLAAAPPVLNALNPINWIRKLARAKNSPEEMQAILNAAPPELRNQLPIGEVLNSGPLKWAQAGTGTIPFSGMAKPYEGINNYLSKEGQGLTQNLLAGRSPETIPQQIYGNIKQSYQTTLNDTNAAYTKFRDVAKQNDVQFNREGVDKAIDSRIDKLTADLERSPIRQEKYQPVIDKLNTMRKTRLNNFDDAENFRRDLNDLYGEALGSDDKILKNAVINLKKELGKTFTESAKVNPEALEALKAADAQFKLKLKFEREVSKGGKSQPTAFFKQFKEEGKGQDPNLDNFLTSYMQRGGDKADTLNNLLRMIPNQADKDLVGAYALKNSFKDDKFNPRAMISDYNRLGPRQQNALFGENNPKLNQLNILAKNFPENFDTDFLPKTGYQWAQHAPGLGMILEGGRNIVMGDPLAAAAYVGLPIAGGIMSKKFLTSPTVRNALMNPNYAAQPFSQTTQDLTKGIAMGAVAKEGSKKKKQETIEDLGFVPLNKGKQ